MSKIDEIIQEMYSQTDGGYGETWYLYKLIKDLEQELSKDTNSCDCPKGSICEFFCANNEGCMYGDV